MGDRILKVNGTDVTAATHQEAVMELLRPGDEIKLTIQHDPLPVGFQVSTEINKTTRSNWWLCYFNSFVHIKPHDVHFTFEFVFAVIFSPSSTSLNCEMWNVCVLFSFRLLLTWILRKVCGTNQIQKTWSA